MDKVIRIIEIASCSILQAYYIAPDKNNTTFESYNKISDIPCGFSTMERAEEIRACFKRLEEKDVDIQIVAEIFDLSELDKHSLPKTGPMFI